MALQEESASYLAGLADFQARFEAKLKEIDNLEKKLAANDIGNLNKKITCTIETNAQMLVLQGKAGTESGMGMILQIAILVAIVAVEAMDFSDGHCSTCLQKNCIHHLHLF